MRSERLPSISHAKWIGKEKDRARVEKVSN
jgi:hypothetical protein